AFRVVRERPSRRTGRKEDSSFIYERRRAELRRERGLAVRDREAPAGTHAHVRRGGDARAPPLPPGAEGGGAARARAPRARRRRDGLDARPIGRMRLSPFTSVISSSSVPSDLRTSTRPASG